MNVFIYIYVYDQFPAVCFRLYLSIRIPRQHSGWLERDLPEAFDPLKSHCRLITSLRTALKTAVVSLTRHLGVALDCVSMIAKGGALASPTYPPSGKVPLFVKSVSMRPPSQPQPPPFPPSPTHSTRLIPTIHNMHSSTIKVQSNSPAAPRRPVLHIRPCTIPPNVGWVEIGRAHV